MTFPSCSRMFSAVLLISIIVLCAVALCSCAGMHGAITADQLTVVSPSVIEAGMSRQSSEHQLSQGRELYIGRCSQCHSLYAPGSRTEDDWREVLVRMSKRSRLDPDQARSVEAFILSARDASLNVPTR